MKTSTSNVLSCAVFGHNLEPMSKSNAYTEHSEIFVCSSCHKKMIVDTSGDFEELPYKNDQIKTALRQLFLLNRRSNEGQFSI